MNLVFLGIHSLQTFCEIDPYPKGKLLRKFKDLFLSDQPHTEKKLFHLHEEMCDYLAPLTDDDKSHLISYLITQLIPHLDSPSWQDLLSSLLEKSHYTQALRAAIENNCPLMAILLMEHPSTALNRILSNIHDHTTHLITAAKQKNLLLCKLLMRHPQTDLNARIHPKYLDDSLIPENALYTAAAQGDLDIVRYFLEHDIQEPGRLHRDLLPSDSGPLLHAATLSNNETLVQFLLTHAIQYPVHSKIIGFPTTPNLKGFLPLNLILRPTCSVNFLHSIRITHLLIDYTSPETLCQNDLLYDQILSLGCCNYYNPEAGYWLHLASPNLEEIWIEFLGRNKDFERARTLGNLVIYHQTERTLLERKHSPKSPPSLSAPRGVFRDVLPLLYHYIYGLEIIEHLLARLPQPDALSLVHHLQQGSKEMTHPSKAHIEPPFMRRDQLYPLVEKLCDSFASDPINMHKSLKQKWKTSFHN